MSKNPHRGGSIIFYDSCAKGNLRRGIIFLTSSLHDQCNPCLDFTARLTRYNKQYNFILDCSVNIFVTEKG